MKDHSWFIGFAPFDNPTIAVAVLVENVGFGGSFAAPIGGLCFEQYVYGRLTRFDPVPKSVADSTGARRPPSAHAEAR